jgi:hypothetical protein
MRRAVTWGVRAINIACLVVRAFVKIDELLQCRWRIFISKPVYHRNALVIPSRHPRSQLIACRWPVFKGDVLTKIVHTSWRGSDREIATRASRHIPCSRANADQVAK